MKSLSDDYRRPLTTAQPVAKGRIFGAHRRVVGSTPIGPDMRWLELAPGESRPILVGTLLQVKGAAGRLQGFWFEEDGSVQGPLHMAIHMGEGLRERLLPNTPVLSRASVAFVVVVNIAFAAFIFAIWEELELWPGHALVELFNTLGLAWAALSVLGVLCLRRETRTGKRVIEIAPPRPQIR